MVSELGAPLATLLEAMATLEGSSAKADVIATNLQNKTGLKVDRAYLDLLIKFKYIGLEKSITTEKDKRYYVHDVILRSFESLRGGDEQPFVDLQGKIFEDIVKDVLKRRIKVAGIICLFNAVLIMHIRNSLLYWLF